MISSIEIICSFDFTAHSAAKSSRSARSARSMQSSLWSEELVLPDETVYSKYDDVIANMDNDVETVVSEAKSREEPGKTESPAVSCSFFFSPSIIPCAELCYKHLLLSIPLLFVLDCLHLYNITSRHFSALTLS